MNNQETVYSEYAADSSDSSFTEEDDPHTTSETSNSADAGDAPQALVRDESKALGVIRFFAVGLLLAVATATSFAAFRFSRDGESRAFQADFESSAESLRLTFLSELSLRFRMIQTLSGAVTATMEAQQVPHTNFSFAPDRMEQLSTGLIHAGRAVRTSWNPQLRTDDERREFEAYVGTLAVGEQVEPCFLCGSPTRTFGNPDSYTDIPGSGTFTCEIMERAGLDGIVIPDLCDLVSKTVSADCFCVDRGEEDQLDILEQIEYPDSLFQYDQNHARIDTPYGTGPYSPMWEIHSGGGLGIPYLFNCYSEDKVARALDQTFEGDVPVISETYYRNTSFSMEFVRVRFGEPTVSMVGPVYNSDGSVIIGSIVSEFPWFRSLQPSKAFSDVPLFVVVENSCGQELSFIPDFTDDSLKFVGAGDLHDTRYKDLIVTSTYDEFEAVMNFGSRIAKNFSTIDFCRYRLRVYPTHEHEKTFVTRKPVYYSLGSALIFLFSAFVFGVYDWLVGRRQAIIMSSAVKTSNIVTSMFPENVRERLYDQAMQKASKLGRRNKVKMENFADGNGDFGLMGDPIADLFPSATVMFFDIENFTVWSSERDPSATFTLLETVYGEFDRMAKSMGVYKVENIGDAYIAVCGLPKKNDDHAMIMAKFAALCLSKFARTTRRLELVLGPSTGDLRARVGLHSGPVVAGVLRGEKARFQLFGDTVNTASRLQSSCKPNCIHSSKNTAGLLIDAGHEDWVREREDKTGVKGMASSQTFWVQPSKMARSECSSVSGSYTSVDDQDAVVQKKSSESRKQQRLINWNVEVLYELLKNLAADRNGRTAKVGELPSSLPLKEGAIVVDELVTVLPMPIFDMERVSRRKNPKAIELPRGVHYQLRKFVTEIAETYRSVPFHNFEHASHVVMSVRKLMKRVVEPDNVDYDNQEAEQLIHEATYGISSDPLLLFTVVFSALIHDADHTGLTNGELVSKKDTLAQTYMERSVAEQNSVDMAWNILNKDEFAQLRGCIYTNQEELQRFRQLLVNAVIATDIADKSLKSLRENRWDAAFASKVDQPESAPFDTEDFDRRATVIYEYIIQAADISHTMQHWNTYMKFNKRLFEERYVAWINGHAPKDPSGGWYGGELWFFDNYIIPLARKLNKCGVFGASYDEFLTYALENRHEWEEKGKVIVPVFLKSCQDMYGMEPASEPCDIERPQRLWSI